MSQTVLILDDEPDNIALIQTTLRRQLPEVGVVTFNAPREALAWCALHEPDLCLVDYKMPGMTGVDFIRAVREFAHFQSVPLIMITGQSDQTLQQRALEIGATDFLAKPYNAPDIVARTRNHLRMRESLRERRADLNGLEHEVLSQARRVVEDEQTRIIERLTRLSGYRDEETSSHMQRLARLARLIAGELGLDRRFRELLLMAAPLHDIGKVGIPDRILLKPGKLDAIEWGIMKTHTRIGYDLLRDSSAEVMQLGAEIAHAHHEKWGGDGYPNGLAGDAIPLAGRIVAVADVFDALLNVRHYKPAWALADTLEQLRAERGRHFDTACVNALLRRLDEAMDIQKQFAEVSATTPAAAIRPPAPMNP